ncbi:hypothetical protein BG011_005192 [Mortierella polycephala]|uniref:Uncharacterized protein n=1 Tax=Mortierella polycephala TaxID=41804 RepID=A0A9P6U0M5_9FUNG|nr:hypothetical protein BG011_005192 [Mortierella polycephala]
MASYIRTLTRLAFRASRPSTAFMTRQAPAAMMTRQYHAFRPTQIVSKGKKHAISDEDDEELEAELQELEKEKREQEALERGETQEGDKDSSDEQSSEFQELYDSLLDRTSPSKKRHELPRHTTLFHLIQKISTAEQAQQLPPLVKQWRRKDLPITIFLSDKLIHAVCKAGSPETALELLGDREAYALTPGQSTMRRVVRSFVKDIAAGEKESEEALEKLDGAFRTLALIPYYNLAADDVSVYANLVRGSLLYGGEEGLRRASATMDEYLLIDGEREKPLTRKKAAEIVAAAELLSKEYEAKEQTDKAKELEKHVEVWRKSL